MARLSVILITYKEEQNVERCLESVRWADEIIVLHRGRLAQHGTPEQLYYQPVDEATAALFGDYNLISGPDRRALLPGRRVKKNTALLVRPEQLELRPAGGDGAGGTVRAVRFLGSYSEVEVALAGQHMRVRLGATHLRPGDEASVSVVAGGGWSIPLVPAAATV